MRKILFISIILFLFSGCKHSIEPVAKQGFADLSKRDFEKNGNVKLFGEWEFYWRQLLTPKDFSEGKIENQDWVIVPNAWNVYSDKNNQNLPPYGFATYRLKIKTPSHHHTLSIQLTEVRDAYRLWANEILIAEHGKVGKSETTTLPRSDARMVTFPVKNGKLELVLQVANYRSSKGGLIRKSPLLGTKANIQKTQFSSIANVLLLCGCYLIIGIYHLLFYQMRKRNRGALYFAYLCFLTFIRVLTTGDKLMVYWTGISTEWNSRLAYLSIYLAIPFFFKYLKTFFPKEISKLFIQIISIGCITLAAFILFAPNSWSHYTNRLFQVFFLVCTCYLTYVLFSAVKNKRRGSTLLTVGMFLVVLTAWNDTFYEDFGIFGGYLFPFGVLVFMLLQTVFLAQIFASNMDNIRRLSETFRKFVPEQFLRRLDENAKNIIPIGVAQEELLTISFSDIRSFSEISEQMSSQELLVFLNDFFEKMDDPIHQNHGFIDKYIGDSIMSVFDRKENDNNMHPQDSVKAAVEMHKIQQRYEDLANPKIPIRFGIGIHTGKVILGTVGSKARMDSTVIGDSVNLASRLESLTKYYDAQIIISETTRKMIHSDDFSIRQIDKVVVKGKSNIVAIYEVFDANPFDLRKMKVESLPSLEQGLDFYYEKKWEMARIHFQKSLSIFPSDSVAKMYLERCDYLEKNPPTEDWKGEFIHEVK